MLFATLRCSDRALHSHSNVVERQPKHVVLDEETVAKRFEHKGLIESMRRVIIHLSGDCEGGGGGSGGGGVSEAATCHRPVQYEHSPKTTNTTVHNVALSLSSPDYQSDKILHTKQPTSG
ncbi:hypothetical protein E2C01_035653 [Portunus trituberculatus]|uniref:Uncharacterized protein n=1 Tax=Portunus trituberculatus TaxID=210409 RepID=A0A5B7F4R2_PORTR|nr:hypothetical protein [Portunus trituberculatus]